MYKLLAILFFKSVKDFFDSKSRNDRCKILVHDFMKLHVLMRLWKVNLVMIAMLEDNTFQWFNQFL